MSNRYKLKLKVSEYDFTLVFSQNVLTGDIGFSFENDEDLKGLVVPGVFGEESKDEIEQVVVKELKETVGDNYELWWEKVEEDE